VIGHIAKFSNVKVILNGGQKITFLRPDGYFTLYPFDPSVIKVSFEYIITHSS
jgi:hypothetical protein